MAKGAAWMVLFKLCERGLGLISTIILARVLMPADFGLIAMAMSVIAILELMSAFGFDVALIQRQEINRDHYDTAWTFNAGFALIAALTLAALAHPTALFYGEPRLEVVMYCLAGLPLIRGVENIGVVDFRIKMDFDKEFKFLLTKKVAAFTVTVPLALALNSYWALVIGMLTGRTAGSLASYLLHPYRPRLSLRAANELFSFSKWLLTNNILTFLKLRSADFVIGRLAGTHALGLYAIAYEIASLPTSELIAPINRAVYSGYAQVSGKMTELRRSVLNVIAMIVLIALPAGTGLALIADPLVRVFLGPNWTAAAPVIAILSFYGVATALQTNLGYVYLALGTPRTLTMLLGAYIAVLIPMVVVLASMAGVTGAAWAYLATACLFLPINYCILFNRIEMHPQLLLSVVWRPLVATGAMTLAVTYTLGSFAAYHSLAEAALQLAAGVFVGAGCYVAALLVLWHRSGCPQGAESDIIGKLSHLARHARGGKRLQNAT